MTSPAGMYSIPLYELRNLVADSAAFRTWVGAADQAAALLRIHVISFEEDPDATDATLEAARPFAVVGFSDSATATKDAVPDRFDHSGTLQLRFEAVAVGAADAAIFLAFLDVIGTIMQEMEDLSGRSGHLVMMEHRIMAGPGRYRESDRTAGELDVIGVDMEIDWAER